MAIRALLLGCVARLAGAAQLTTAELSSAGLSGAISYATIAADSTTAPSDATTAYTLSVYRAGSLELITLELKAGYKGWIGVGPGTAMSAAKYMAMAWAASATTWTLSPRKTALEVTPEFDAGSTLKMIPALCSVRRQSRSC